MEMLLVTLFMFFPLHLILSLKQTVKEIITILPTSSFIIQMVVKSSFAAMLTIKLGNIYWRITRAKFQT